MVHSTIKLGRIYSIYDEATPKSDAIQIIAGRCSPISEKRATVCTIKIVAIGSSIKKMEICSGEKLSSVLKNSDSTGLNMELAAETNRHMAT